MLKLVHIHVCRSAEDWRRRSLRQGMLARQNPGPGRSTQAEVDPPSVCNEVTPRGVETHPALRRTSLRSHPESDRAALCTFEVHRNDRAARHDRLVAAIRFQHFFPCRDVDATEIVGAVDEFDADLIAIERVAGSHFESYQDAVSRTLHHVGRKRLFGREQGLGLGRQRAHRHPNNQQSFPQRVHFVAPSETNLHDTAMRAVGGPDHPRIQRDHPYDRHHHGGVRTPTTPPEGAMRSDHAVSRTRQRSRAMSGSDAGGGWPFATPSHPARSICGALPS